MHKPKSLLVAGVLLVTLSGPAMSGPSKAGVWHNDGYHTGPDGKRLPCETGFCTNFPALADRLSKTCAPADALEPYATDHLRQIAQMFSVRSHNCKETTLSNSTTHEERKLECDEGSLTQRIDQPDDSHLTYVSIIEGSQGPASRLEAGASFEWLGSDCTGVTSVIRETGPRP